VVKWMRDNRRNILGIIRESSHKIVNRRHWGRVFILDRRVSHWGRLDFWDFVTLGSDHAKYLILKRMISQNRLIGGL